jgi:imidazolonepropionase-like amidohydrolase
MPTARNITSIVALTVLGTCGARAHELRIEHVTIVSPERAVPMHDASIKVEDDRITAIVRGDFSAAPAGNVETIEGKGLYVTPGLIDSHVHTSDLPGIVNGHAPPKEIDAAISRQIPRSYLYFGYTTLIDLISTPERIPAWSAYEAHPDLYFCGGAPIPGGYPQSNVVVEADRRALNRYMLIERGQESKAPQGMDPAAHTPAAVVARMKQDGAVCVKTFFERGFEGVELPVPGLDTIRELVKAAHAAHLPVLIHANSTEAQEFGVKAGVDIMAHGLWNWSGDPGASELTPRVKSALDSVLKANIGWQPTMQVIYGLRDLFDPGYLADPSLLHVTPASAIEWYRSAQGQWYHDVLVPSFLPKPVQNSADVQGQWHAVQERLAPPILHDKNATHYMALHGARFLFGTDTPSSPTYANQPGLNGWREMQHMVAAGMTLPQIFRAATQTNAEVLGLSREVGTVEVGKRANLLLLRADPTQTLEAYNEIVKVVVRGRVLDREALAADHAPPSKP